MGKKTMAVAIAVMVCLLGMQVAAAGEAKALVTLKAGPVTGKVAAATGVPVDTASVKIVDMDRNVVADLKTDKAGKFVTEPLSAGAYTVTIAEKHTLEIAVAEDAKASSLVVILPASKSYAAGQAGGMSPGLKTGLLVGGGAATVAGASIIIHNSTDGGDGGDNGEQPGPPPVSP